MDKILIVCYKGMKHYRLKNALIFKYESDEMVRVEFGNGFLREDNLTKIDVINDIIKTLDKTKEELLGVINNL